MRLWRRYHPNAQAYFSELRDISSDALAFIREGLNLH